jgi:Fe2+ or Zn2+ uptake regulation protein
MMAWGASLLRDAGLRVTSQRLAVLDALSQASHPTADEIHHVVRLRHPGVGLATVYNTLAALETHGRVLVVEDRKGRRYDFRTDTHPHIRCRKCGAFADLAWPEGTGPAGWQVESVLVTAEGICPRCHPPESSDDEA